MSGSAGYEVIAESLNQLKMAMDELKIAEKELEALNQLAYENDIEKAEWEAQIELVENAPIIVKRELNGGLCIKAKDEQNEKAVNSVKLLKQTYSRLKVINELKQKGYDKVKEVKMPDGSIRMVVQKWQ